MKKILVAFLLLFGFAFGAEAVDDKTIKIIAAHAYAGHSCDFPKLKSVEDMEKYIKNIITAPGTTSKALENGRQAFLSDKTVIITDPNATGANKGTCFKPSGSDDLATKKSAKAYYDRIDKK